MFSVLMELDKLNEGWRSRQELIHELKALGIRYNFDKYSDAQLSRILERAEAEIKAKNDEQAAYSELAGKPDAEKPICAECGKVLTDGGFCPVCDDGEEHY